MKMFRVLLSFLVLVPGLSAAPADPGGGCIDFEITSRLSTGHVPASSRIIMDWPRGRSGIVLEFGGGGPRLVSGGIDSTLFTAGTLAPKGLFREMNGPAGYSAGSAVFLEPDRYVLDRGFTRVGRYGLIFHPFPGFGSCIFVTGNTSGTVSAGVLGVIPLADRLTLSLLLGGGIFPPPDAGGSVWFFDSPEPAAVPAIGHGAAKVMLKRRVLRISVCGGGSVSESLQPGGFLRGFAALHLPRFGVRIFASLAGDSYTGPSGEYPGRLFAFGSCGTLTPLKFLCIEAEYTRSLGRPAPGPALCIPSDDELLCRIGVNGGPFEAAAEWKRDFAVDSDGSYSGGDTFRAEAGLKGDVITGGVWGEAALSPYRNTDCAFGLEFSVKGGIWRLETEGRLSLGDIAILKGGLTAGFDTGTHAVEAEGSLETGDLNGSEGGTELIWEIEVCYKFKMSRAVSK